MGKVLGIVETPLDVPLPKPVQRGVSERIAAPEPSLELEQPVKICYPMIAPDKARRAFEWPSEFGEWSIYVSSTAVRQLRQLRRRPGGPHWFKIIQVKIVELSRGNRYRSRNCC